MHIIKYLVKQASLVIKYQAFISLLCCSLWLDHQNADRQQCKRINKHTERAKKNYKQTHTGHIKNKKNKQMEGNVYTEQIDALLGLPLFNNSVGL